MPWLGVGVRPWWRYPKQVPLLESLERRRLLSRYFFSLDGSDTAGNGSQQRPWATLAKADSLSLQPGDSILLRGSETFVGNLWLGPNDAGTAVNPVIVQSYGWGIATLESPTGVGIFAHDCGGVTIMNLHLAGPGRDAATADGIQFLNDLPAGKRLGYIDINQVDISGFTNGIEIDAIPKNGLGKNGYDHIRITDAALRDDSTNGIFTEGNFSQTSTQYSFSDVYIGYDSASWVFHHADGTDTEDGIQLSDVNGGAVDHCVAHDNGLSGNGEVGIWAWDCNNVIIQDCASYRNHTGGASDGDGFDLDGGDTNCIMQYNHSYDNDGAGFALFQFQYARPYHGNIIRDNTSFDDGRTNQYGAIDVWNGNGSEGISNCQIYGNTICVSPSAGAAPSAIQFENFTSDIEISDNDLFTTSGVPLVQILTPQSGLVFKRNSYSSAGAFRIVEAGKHYDNASEWAAAIA